MRDYYNTVITFRRELVKNNLPILFDKHALKPARHKPDDFTNTTKIHEA